MVGEARGIFLWSLCAETIFVFYFVFITCFSLFCFDCVLFSKMESFGLGLSFNFFVFYWILVKLESDFVKLVSCVGYFSLLYNSFQPG